MKKLRRGIVVLLSLAMMFSLCACAGNSRGSVSKDDMEEEVNSIWYIQGTEPNGFDEVLEEFNEYTKAKINATVDLRFIQAGDWQQKTNMMMAAQEEFDLIWTADWALDFANMVDMGALIPLNDLLEESPQLKEMYSDEVWAGTAFDGKIYGVPNNQVIYEQKGLWFKKDIVEKYDLPVYDIKSLDDLTEILQTVKDNEPADIIPVRAGYPTQFAPLETTVKNFAIRDGKVIDPVVEDNQLEAYKLMRDWYERGLLPADVGTMTDDTSLLKAGKIFSRYTRILPGAEEKTRLSYDYDVICVPTVDPLILRASVQSTMTSISATSKHPERALKLIELMQTDKYPLNLICYGIEGRDYEKDPENENRMLRSSGDYYVAEFLVGNQFLAYLQPSYSDTVWEETEAANKAAAVDPNIGFAFDQSVVNSEITNLESVSKEFTTVLTNGLGDPETTYQTMIEKKNLAGKEKVMEEIQNQYDAWAANNQ